MKRGSMRAATLCVYASGASVMERRKIGGEYREGGYNADVKAVVTGGEYREGGYNAGCESGGDGATENWVWDRE